MTAGVFDLYIENGATLTLPIVFKDGTGTPVDLTGYTVEMQIRQTVSAPDVEVVLTVANGGIVWVDQAHGAFNLNLTPAQTQNLLAGVYAIELTSSTGVVSRLLEGAATVSPEVVR